MHPFHGWWNGDAALVGVDLAAGSVPLRDELPVSADRNDRVSDGSSLPHSENHLVDRICWLRAAALGANDGIITNASLIVGVAAASANPNDVLIAGVAGLVSGAKLQVTQQLIAKDAWAPSRGSSLGSRH